jgi:hypothetical protein
VRKPGETNYGVELMSAGDTALQTRVVAFERAGRGSEGIPRDKEVEEAWCSDFEQLRSLMSGAGFETVLRQAMPAGAVKLKVVPEDRMEARTSGTWGTRAGEDLTRREFAGGVKGALKFVPGSIHNRTISRARSRPSRNGRGPRNADRPPEPRRTEMSDRCRCSASVGSAITRRGATTGSPNPMLHSPPIYYISAKMRSKTQHIDNLESLY